MCDVGYLCANFSLPRPLCSRLRPDVRDRRQTDGQTDRHRPYSQFAITINSNVCPHIRVLNMLMKKSYA